MTKDKHLITNVSWEVDDGDDVVAVIKNYDEVLDEFIGLEEVEIRARPESVRVEDGLTHVQFDIAATYRVEENVLKVF